MMMEIWQFVVLIVVNIITIIGTSYFTEKGKNIATKEDIGKITDEIKKVESIYNNSLEKYKIELQKDLYSSQYMIDFCNKLDMQLIEKMVECIKYIDDQMKEGFTGTEINAIYEGIEEIIDFIETYYNRYSSIQEVKDMKKSFSSLKHIKNNEVEYDSMDLIAQYRGDIEYISRQMYSILSIFLPKFNTDKSITQASPAL